MAGVSEALLNLVDEEVRKITDECYAQARRLLRENRGKLDAIVAALLARESLDEADVYAAVGLPRPVARPSAPLVPAAPAASALAERPQASAERRGGPMASS